MENGHTLCNLGRHTGPKFVNELVQNCIGMDIASGPRMRAKAIAVARVSRQRKLHLVMAPTDSERPTNIENLAPDSRHPVEDEGADGHSVVIPKAAAVPGQWGESDDPPLELPKNPSMLERAAFQILQGMRKLTSAEDGFEAMLKASEERAERRAVERERGLNANVELIRKQVETMGKTLGEYSAKVDAVADMPRQFEELRQRVDKMEREWIALQKSCGITPPSA